MSGRRYHAGLAAEAQVARYYEARGGTIRERRLRTAAGEIDLVVQTGTMLIFVEVKARKRMGPDSPITEKQWQRLGLAAESYMLNYTSMTGAAPLCRFDAALIGPDGSLEVIENARIQY
ncbi:MAG: YraN family protein [Pseudomonadota bacterium]